MEFMQVFKISMGQKEENITIREETEGRERGRESRLKACMELLAVIFQVESWSD